MNVLVVGQGGREHVLTWKLAQSKLVKKIYCAPGNYGMTPEAECVAICATDCGALADFAKDKKIDLTIVGPEAPLVEGIVDRFKREGLKVFGPDSYCAQLEGSKAFSKEVMQRLGIPTAKYKEFDSSASALEYLKTSPYPIVIKADGLAAGKGVTIAEDYRTAEETVKFIMDNKGFGDAGAKIVVEEFLRGEEVSLIAVSDGKTVLNLASSQDHKRIFDDDKGPNTGGMGAYSPAPIADDELMNFAQKHIFEPIIRFMSEEGHPYVGFLYAGIMVTASGPKVLEFNVRFGDPEAQVVLTRLESDFLELVQACVNQRLAEYRPVWRDGSAVTVVLASKGYPASSSKGDKISGIDEAVQIPDVNIFHAGTDFRDNALITSGGRVMNVTAFGSSVQEAVDRVYQAVSKISFDGMQYRKDIAHRALARQAR